MAPAVRKAEMMGPESRLQMKPTRRPPNNRYRIPTIKETCNTVLKHQSQRLLVIGPLLECSSPSKQSRKSRLNRCRQTLKIRLETGPFVDMDKHLYCGFVIGRLHGWILWLVWVLVDVRSRYGLGETVIQEQRHQGDRAQSLQQHPLTHIKSEKVESRQFLVPQFTGRRKAT